MKTRLITSFVGALLFFIVLLSKPIVFQSAVIIVAGMAIYELYAVTGTLKKPAVAISGVFGVLWCALLGCMHINSQTVSFDTCLLCLALYIGVLFALTVFKHEKVSFNDAAIGFLAAIMIGFLYSFIIPLREGRWGVGLILVLFAATWCNDAGAYFVGIRYGKTPLAPKLSPKKTVEGAIGGVLGSTVAMLIFAFIAGVFFKAHINFVGLILTGFGCSVLGPVSDLAASAIKREYGVKDYGNLFPGHGGIMDRFDSVLLTAPFVYYMNEIFTLVG